MKEYFRFCFGLREFLKNTISLEESKEIIERRMEKREQSFLEIVKKGVYGNKRSPYLKLLRLSNYDFKDIESLVLDVGIEETLGILRRHGIYFTMEEFKGKKEVVRKGISFEVKERDFDNPFLSDCYEISSGATRSAGTRIRIDFDFLTQKSAYNVFMLDMYEALQSPIALWFPIYPGAPGINSMLRFTKIGKPPLKWYSQVEKWNRRISLKKRLGINYIIYMGRALGAKFPKPEFADLDSASKIAEWISTMIANFSTCLVYTFVSSAARICLAANEKDLQIAGTKFIVTGEPLTPKKREVIESTGGIVIPVYGISEGGVIGAGCTERNACDDVHLFKDSFAVIQHKRKVGLGNISVNAFLFTTLLPHAPKILLNVETGDYGIVESRNCKCKFGELGFSDHIYNIRSFEKLTGEGVTFVGTDFIRIIEEVLPHKFGGTAMDYQVLEEEDDKGFTRLIVIVSPNIGEINEKDLLDTLFHELRTGKHASTPDTWSQAGPEMWSQAGMFQVKRMYPVPTRGMKVLPFHIAKS